MANIGTMFQKETIARYMREYPGLVDLMDNPLFKTDKWAWHNYRLVLGFYHYHSYHLEVFPGDGNAIGEVIVHTRPRFDGDTVHYVGTFDKLDETLEWILIESIQGVFHRKIEADKKCPLQDQIDQLTINQSNLIHFIKQLGVQ